MTELTITNQQLNRLSDHAHRQIVAGIVAGQQLIFDDGIVTPLRLCHFLAQVCHESDGLVTTTEYASGRNYEGRKDLGNTEKGDGVAFRGRGLIQLTGRSNYAEFSASKYSLGRDVISNPGDVASFPWALTSALFFWHRHDLNRLADKDDLAAVTKIVNGGMNGYEDRKSYLKRAKSIWLGANILEVGSVGEEVVDLQLRLASWGYRLVADGFFGIKTSSALKDFQRTKGLEVTGTFNVDDPCVSFRS